MKVKGLPPSFTSQRKLFLSSGYTEWFVLSFMSLFTITVIAIMQFFYLALRMLTDAAL